MSDILFPVSGSGNGGSLDEVTANPEDVLAPKDFLDRNGDIATGTMPNLNEWVSNVEMNDQVTIPKGYHNGSGTVKGPSVTQKGAWTSRLGINGKVMIPEGYHNGNGYVDQDISTLGEQKVVPKLSRHTLWTANQYMTGNVIIEPIPNQRIAGTKNNSCGINGSGLFYYIPEGYYIPDSTGFSWVYATLPDVAAALGITPDKVKKGTTLCGVTGTWEGYVAGAKDLYYFGANPSGFRTEHVDQSITVEYQNTCIQIVSKVNAANNARIVASNPHNFSGYRNIVMEFEVSGTLSQGNMDIYFKRDSSSGSTIASFIQAFSEGKHTIRASLTGHQTSFRLLVQIAARNKTMRINRIYLE